MKTTLLDSPDSQLDNSVEPLIEKWSDPPKAIEVLEVLDKYVRYSLSSGMVVALFQLEYEAALKRENKSHDEVVKCATWRDPPDPESSSPPESSEKIEIPCELPEGQGLEWKRKNFFGAGILELYQNGQKIGQCTEGMRSDGTVYWFAFDGKHSTNGISPVVGKGSLIEASEALVKAIIE